MSAEYMHIGIPRHQPQAQHDLQRGAKFWVSNVDDYDYKIDANRALEAFTGRWVPVPFLRLSNEQWKDGAFKCEKGPSNWARLHVSREDSDGAYRLTFLFDTTIEEREQPRASISPCATTTWRRTPVSHFRPKAATTRGSSIRCGSTNGSPKSTMPPDRAPQRADHMAREYAVHHGAPRHVPDAP